MTEKVNIEKNPTKLFAHDILNFTKDIECMYTTLPLIMQLMQAVDENAEKIYHAFLEERSSGITEDDNDKIYNYSIKIEDISKHNRLRRQYDNSHTAVKLIPRTFVTSLVAQYDSFLGRIIRFIYAVKPQILNASEKSIPYTDLINFPNIEGAKEYIIEKEVEAIIRKSHADQFSWLKEKMGTPFNKDLKCWPIFIELTERRNLFVHCDGKVSSQYLTVCAEHKSDMINELSVGDQLNVTPAYFEEAYKCIYEIGVKLAHVIWRRLSQDHLDGSDNNIIDITYSLIENGEYDIAIRLLDYFTQDQIKHANEANKRVLIINKAQAYKWSNNNDKCIKILDGTDWSACGDHFKLANYVLKEDYQNAYNMMNKLKSEKSFLKTHYKDWPLFKDFRKQQDFAKVYEECYGESFVIRKRKEQINLSIERNTFHDCE